MIDSYAQVFGARHAQRQEESALCRIVLIAASPPSIR